jgi:hypothetical protein
MFSIPTKPMSREDEMLVMEIIVVTESDLLTSWMFLLLTSKQARSVVFKLIIRSASISASYL